MRGLGVRYYSLPISFQTYGTAQQMLQTVKKKNWSDAFAGKSYALQKKETKKRTEEMLKMTDLFTKVCVYFFN